MPRLKKPRTCGCDFSKLGPGAAFKPTGVPMGKLDRLPLHLDEIEAMRLCDAEGLTQAEAGQQMGVSRGTVQRILASGRATVARALSGCKAIVLVTEPTTKQGGRTS